jgi:formylmethanofuran dehydrogenase subunit E
MNIPDSYDQWEAHDIELERKRARRPECCYCGEKIQDEEAYLINGDFYCEECMEREFKVLVDDYTED